MRIYTIDPITVDDLLGVGTWEDYQSLHDDYESEWDGADQNLTRFSSFFGKLKSNQLKADQSLCEKIDDDYGRFLEQVSKGDRADDDTNVSMSSVFEKAIAVLRASNRVLDYCFESGIYTFLIALESATFVQKSRALKRSLDDLEKAIRTAKMETYASGGQFVLDGAIAMLTVYSPPLGLIGRGGVAVFQMVFDTYVGASTSDTATWSSRGNTTVGAYADAFDDYLELNKSRKVFTNGLGKTCTIIGFAFDVNEAYSGYRNVKDLEAKMADAVKRNDELDAEIARVQTNLKTFFTKLKILKHKSESDLKMAAFKLRLNLLDAMKRTGYDPVGSYTVRY